MKLESNEKRKSNGNGKIITWLTLFISFLCGVNSFYLKADDCTVLKAEIQPEIVPPGSFFKATYCFEAPRPLSTAYKVFVHFIDNNGKMAFQADHMPPVGTGTPGWNGKISYAERVTVGTNIPDGKYKMLIGLYKGDQRLELKTGDGVVNAGERRYQVAEIVVDSSAPRPKADTEGTPTLNLDGFRMTFCEEFDSPLDVSPWGPGTRWIAHTPWNGDFGDARFADPDVLDKNFPFTCENGILRIEARKSQVFAETDPYKRSWASGLLSSNDPKGNGFSQQYGYFEIRAKLPAGPGVWPAFWLCSSYDRTDPEAGKDGALEVDVFEYYGHYPNGFTATMHVWLPPPHKAEGTMIYTRENEVVSDFNNFGVLIEPDWSRFYFNGIEVWKTKTPSEHNKPLMILLNLALGSGWPIDKTPNPSYMYVDYVKAWSHYTATPKILTDKKILSPGESATISIICDMNDAKIYYTIDGSEPDHKSTIYTKPFTVSEHSVIKAVAFTQDLKPSAIATKIIRHSYGVSGSIGINFFNEDKDEQKLLPQDIAGVSEFAHVNWNNMTISRDDESGYANYGKNEKITDSSGKIIEGLFVEVSAGNILWPATAATWGFKDQNLKLQLGYLYPKPVIKIEGIPYSKYDVVVYLSAGDNGGIGKVSISSLEDSDNKIENSSTFYYNYNWQDGKFVCAVDKTVQDGKDVSGANYVLFRNNTSKSLRISIDGTIKGGWTGISGIQIIPVNKKKF